MYANSAAAGLDHSNMSAETQAVLDQALKALTFNEAARPSQAKPRPNVGQMLAKHRGHKSNGGTGESMDGGSGPTSGAPVSSPYVAHNSLGRSDYHSELAPNAPISIPTLGDEERARLLDKVHSEVAEEIRILKSKVALDSSLAQTPPQQAAQQQQQPHHQAGAAKPDVTDSSSFWTDLKGKVAQPPASSPPRPEKPPPPPSAAEVHAAEVPMSSQPMTSILSFLDKKPPPPTPPPSGGGQAAARPVPASEAAERAQSEVKRHQERLAAEQAALREQQRALQERQELLNEEARLRMLESARADQMDAQRQRELHAIYHGQQSGGAGAPPPPPDHAPPHRVTSDGAPAYTDVPHQHNWGGSEEAPRAPAAPARAPLPPVPKLVLSHLQSEAPPLPPNLPIPGVPMDRHSPRTLDETVMMQHNPLHCPTTSSHTDTLLRTIQSHPPLHLSARRGVRFVDDIGPHHHHHHHPYAPYHPSPARGAAPEESEPRGRPQEPPSAPPFPMIELDVGANRTASALVTWRDPRPAGGAGPSGAPPMYELQTRGGRDAAWRTAWVGSLLTCSLAGLLQDCEYELRMRKVTSGAGEWSEATRFVTPKSAPPPPREREPYAGSAAATGPWRQIQGFERELWTSGVSGGQVLYEWDGESDGRKVSPPVLTTPAKGAPGERRSMVPDYSPGSFYATTRGNQRTLNAVV